MAKVLLVISTLRGHGGAETVGTWLARALFRAGHQVGIAEVYDGKDRPITYEITEGIAVYHLNVDEGNRLRSNIAQVSRALRDLIRSNGYSTCIYEGDYQSFLGLKATLTTKGCTFIHHDHGAIASQWGFNKITLMRALGAYACDYVAVLTQQSKEFYHHRLRVAHKKLRVMLNPLVKHLKPTDQNLTESSGAGKILWAGRFTAEKGIQRIIPATQRALKTHPAWSAHIYGTGVLADELEGAILSSEYPQGYHLEGFATDMAQVYQQHQIGIMTSDREGLPLFLIEAQSAGLPCVAFDVVTGPSEVIVDGETGFLIEPFNCEQFNEKLSLLLHDDELRKTMGAAAQERAKRYAESVVIEAWEDVIR